MRVSLARFRDLVGRSRAPVKARLLNQQALAGVGNLLADEALWRAGIDPRRRGVDLDDDELARLRRAVRAAIRGAIKAGGTGRSAFARSRALGLAHATARSCRSPRSAGAPPAGARRTSPWSAQAQSLREARPVRR